MLLQKIDGVPPPVAQASGGAAVSTAPLPIGPEPGSKVAAPARAEPTAEEVRAAAASANRSMQGLSKALEFEVDAETNRVVVRLVDTEDHRVLRQVPSQEMLDIARALERMQTQLVRSKA